MYPGGPGGKRKAQGSEILAGRGGNNRPSCYFRCLRRIVRFDYGPGIIC